MRLSRSASLPDVRHKIPDGLHVHVVRLQNGVRQQPDGRQRRFQLVAGVGHKPAAQAFSVVWSRSVRLLNSSADLGDLVACRGTSARWL